MASPARPRTALIAAAAFVQAAIGIVVVVPRTIEATADAKLDAVIAELVAPPPRPAAVLRRPTPGATSTSLGAGSPDPRGRSGESLVATTIPSTPAAPLTREDVEARPASPGAAPPAAVAADVEDEFDGKGVARASADQQVLLAKAVCSAFDQGYSREEIISRALEEDGTTAGGIGRFIDVAVVTTCPEHADR